MSDNEKEKPQDPPNPFEEIQKQVQDMFKSGNMQFFPNTDIQTDDNKKEPADLQQETEKEEALEKIQSFSFKPREIKDYLDRFVIQQDEAKKVLSVAICDHYNHIRRCLKNPELSEQQYAKQNMILLGPTGVGKTYLIKTLSKLIGVPFIKADATKFSETGYVGYDVDDIARDLVKAANGDTELAQYGIIYIDEIDKIAAQSSSGSKDVSGRGVQVNLLKLMEETDVNLTSQTDMMGQMSAMLDMQRTGKRPQTSINTRHMLVIVSGAFTPMTEIIKKRLSKSSIGFGSDPSNHLEEDNEYLKQVETSDFVAYGFEPEFIGRLPIRVSCNTLKTADLKQILTTAEGNILGQYRDDFQGYHIDLRFNDDALESIAQKAAQEKTGARGLMTVLENILRNFKFELPSTTVNTLTINNDTINQPQAALQNILENQQDAQQELMRQEVQAFAQRFTQEHDIHLTFNTAATTAIITHSLTAKKTIRSWCEKRFRDFQFALKLISKNTGNNTFTITKTLVEKTDTALSKLVVESYKHLADQNQES